MEVLTDPSEMEYDFRRMPSTWELVLPISKIANDLGMDTSRALQKQLAVDLPRSFVVVHGVRATTPSEVMRATRLGRFCTQAVLAPPIEWLLFRMMLIAHEPAAHEEEQHTPMPMIVFVEHQSVHVIKRLCLREWMNEVSCGEVLLEFYADEASGLCSYKFTLKTQQHGVKQVNGGIA